MAHKSFLVAIGLPVAATLAFSASATPPQGEVGAEQVVVLGTRVHAMPFRAAGEQNGITPAVVGNLAYYGGRVISNVKVYAVNWGPNVNATVSSGIGGFYTAITNSAYFDWLGEYNTVGKSPGTNQRIGRGTFGASYTITPSVQSSALTDAQIQTELASQIQAGKLPQPDVDAHGNVNAIYMIDFPPGVSITTADGTQSCVRGGFCAYHGTISLGGKSVYYGVHPDLTGTCATGCGGDPVMFNNATSIHSHELVEAVTDAEVGLVGQSLGPPLAWYDGAQGAGEIGDICNAQQQKVGNYVVQAEWSNAAGSCITTRNLPLCTGANDPCRQCSAADSGSACTGATPVCATDAADAKHGLCVQCVAAKDCSGATPICDRTSDTCRGCTASSECGAGAPVCDTAHGKCLECVANADCKAGTCDTTTNTCAECSTNAQCTGDKPVCTNRRCTGCTTNADCSRGSACDVPSGACVAGKSGGGGGNGGGGGGGNPNSPGGGNGWNFHQANTNSSCALGGAGSNGVGYGAIAGLVFAAVAVARRRRSPSRPRD